MISKETKGYQILEQRMHDESPELDSYQIKYTLADYLVSSIKMIVGIKKCGDILFIPICFEPVRMHSRACLIRPQESPNVNL